MDRKTYTPDIEELHPQFLILVDRIRTIDWPKDKHGSSYPSQVWEMLHCRPRYIGLYKVWTSTGARSEILFWIFITPFVLPLYAVHRLNDLLTIAFPRDAEYVEWKQDNDCACVQQRCSNIYLIRLPSLPTSVAIAPSSGRTPPLIPRSHVDHTKALRRSQWPVGNLSDLVTASSLSEDPSSYTAPSCDYYMDRSAAALVCIDNSYDNWSTEARILS